MARSQAMGGIPQILGTAQARLVRLEVVVLFIVFILTVLVLNRYVQRGFMGVVYSMSYVAVSYAIGLIQDGPFHDEAFVLWAAALLVIQASAMSTSETKALLLVKSAGRCEQACGHVQRKKLLLQHVLQTGLVLWLIVNMRSQNPCYRAAIWALWAFSLLKTAAEIADVTKVGRPDPSVKVLHEYMAAVENEPDGHQPPDPATMQGYRYIFHGEEAVVHAARGHNQSPATSVVTIDQVYQWIDRQPHSDSEKGRAKDLCLAFALFKLLKRRFYGYVPAEAGSDKARRLVLTELIRAGPTGPDAAFRVVEAELAFLYVFFYTRNIPLLVVGPKTYICVTVVVACLAISSVLFGTLAPAYRPLPTGVCDLDRAITELIVVVTAGLEVCQAVAGLSSDWRYVIWTCTGACATTSGGVLAEFWTDFLLFLAPSDNVHIHAEVLGADGEFMTQMWALLSHAGVLERPLGIGSDAVNRVIERPV